MSPVGVVGKKKKNPPQNNSQNKQMKKNPPVLSLVVKRNPVFSEDLGESGVCGVWPHHPELLLGALA